MTEAIEKINEIEETVEIEQEQPYKFRRLGAEDIFPMFTIIKKIGFKEFKTVMGEGEEFKKLISLATKKEGNEETNIIESGLSVAMDIGDIIIGNLPKCENEIFMLLAQTSNLKEKEIRKLDFATFFEMIVDFVKKEEFKDFIKAVSKLFR
jgi:hypothetical protein